MSKAQAEEIRLLIREEIAKAIAPANARVSSAPPCQDCIDGDRVVKGTNFKGRRTRSDGVVLRRVHCLDCKNSWDITALSITPT